jgi:hypothetical protein
MIPRRVRLAILIAVLCHGFFILTARYRFSYDAYTHMLFANHYAENWFSLWEPRWYTGFTVVSYPPLAHQLIAVFLPLLGFDKAFALILWIVTSCYPLGVYAFSRIFAGKTASAYATFVAALLLPIYVTAYVFGQLPFLTSTLFALFGAAALSRYIRKGGFYNLAVAIGFATITMAAHHATLMVQPFLFLSVIVSQINKDNWKLVMFRFARYCVPVVLTGLIVIWPFWQWGTYQVMQTPIDHLSRHNFFKDPLALAIFFFPLYGPLVGIIPFLVRKWHTRLLGLLISFLTLFILGLGGTTPLPRLFFGPSWAWLTYDRFAFWASLTLTPFFGMLFIELKKNLRAPSQSTPITPRKSPIPTLILSTFAVTALGAWFSPILFPTQPKPIDMKPIVAFLNEADHSDWRYITLGFGNQFAYLNLLTKATTIDGSYHTARTLPELRESGIAEIDTAYWASKGIPAIIPILQKSGEHGVRWAFVNPHTLQTIPFHGKYVRQSLFAQTLDQLGWIRWKTLSNGVWVYENPHVIAPASEKLPADSPVASFSWGMFPLLSLICTFSLALVPFRKSIRLRMRVPKIPRLATATTDQAETTRDKYQTSQPHSSQ